MGVPYVWGGSTPSGFDCSGFTSYVMAKNGITIPRTAALQFGSGTSVAKANLKIGDLVFFTTYTAGASHVGFYLGDGNFIHASSAAGKVTISNLNTSSYYSSRFLGGRRYF
jgi:peptidoglycan DL-endopeptidase CwlO